MGDPESPPDPPPAPRATPVLRCARRVPDPWSVPFPPLVVVVERPDVGPPGSLVSFPSFVDDGAVVVDPDPGVMFPAVGDVGFPSGDTFGAAVGGGAVGGGGSVGGGAQLATEQNDTNPGAPPVP